MAATLRALFLRLYFVPFYQLLYTSELSPATSPKVIAEIIVQARTYNIGRGITGLLLFDGAHFVQVLEGERDDVIALMQKIEHDHRHFAVTRLHEGSVEARHFQTFSLGYWYFEDESRVMKLREMRGHAAMEELRSRHLEFDVAS